MLSTWLLEGRNIHAPFAPAQILDGDPLQVLCVVAPTDLIGAVDRPRILAGTMDRSAWSSGTNGEVQARGRGRYGEIYGAVV